MSIIESLSARIEALEIQQGALIAELDASTEASEEYRIIRAYRANRKTLRTLNQEIQDIRNELAAENEYAHADWYYDHCC